MLPPTPGLLLTTLRRRKLSLQTSQKSLLYNSSEGAEFIHNYNEPGTSHTHSLTHTLTHSHTHTLTLTHTSSLTNAGQKSQPEYVTTESLSHKIDDM
jgi:hypothetical protein